MCAFARFAGFFALLLVNAHAFALGKSTDVADVFFDRGSAAISGFHHELDRLGCRAGQIKLEAIIAIGHSDLKENNAQALSEQRAESVKTRLVLLGVPPDRIHAEGKGSSQIISRVDPAKNRRVELEMVGLRGEKPIANCKPGWNKLLAELPLPDALTLARAQVRNGLMLPWGPAASAISAGRVDLLDSFLEGPGSIPLQAVDRVALMQIAVLNGDSGFVSRMVRFGVDIGDIKDPELPVIWASCEADPTSVSELAQTCIVEELLGWGAKPSAIAAAGAHGSRALGCAAALDRVALLGRLLSAGANPDLPVLQPPILAAARYPRVVRQLVEAGANVHVRSESGSTLFHEFRFTDPGEVTWLRGLGLNINARAEGGATPLRRAVGYASPDVLDASAANGAVIPVDDAMILEAALGNLPALSWLIDHGASVEAIRRSRMALHVARLGDLAVPVFEALGRRGVELNGGNQDGNTLLLLAIEALAPELVQKLLDLGAVRAPWEARSARGFAERIPIRRQLVACVDCFPPIDWYGAEYHRLNNEGALADRRRRQERIIEILKAAEGGKQ